MSTVEDLWKKLELPKGNANSRRRSKTSSNDGAINDTDKLQPGTEEHIYDNRLPEVGDGDYHGDPFDIHPDGDLGDCDSELELINLNPRVSREFSLSKYDVGIRHFQNGPEADIRNSRNSTGRRSHEYIYEHDETGEQEGDGAYEHLSKKVTFRDSYEGEEVVSNDGEDSGHVICDCEDCINQTEAVDCHCENCVQARETTLDSPHTSSPREVTCDCEDCLNHSGDSYTCDCENCLNASGNEVRGLNNNHPDDLCKCAECVDQGTHHQNGKCTCAQCRNELSDINTSGHSAASDTFKPQEFSPLDKQNGVLKLHKSAFVRGGNAGANKGDNTTVIKPGSGNVQYIGAESFPKAGSGVIDTHGNRVDVEFRLGSSASPSDGSLEGISFSEHELLSGSEKSCECDSCSDLPPKGHMTIQQPISPNISA